MDVNAAIVDQRLEAIKDEIRENARDVLNVADEEKLKSLAFVFLTVRTVLDISAEEAFDALTDGSQDFGVDALYVSEERDNDFTVNIFQGKYARKLEGSSTFDESGIRALIVAIRHLFDPNSKIVNINRRLQALVDDVRSKIRDGYIPQIRAIACNNGQKWNAAAQELIDKENFGEQVAFEHVNHNTLIRILQAPKTVNDDIVLLGKAIVEDFNYSRVLIGRVSVAEIHNLIERHGERLLERNIRRYLGLQGNRVNEAIRNTLENAEDSASFYFFNNGITLTCDRFNYNALQSENYRVKIDNLQIINGGQTCMTIHKTLLTNPDLAKDATVLVRLYQLPSDNQDLVQRITYATNSQNPVDLRANDEKQHDLEMDIAQLGFIYKRKRSDSVNTTDITIQTAAEAILSIWRKKPHQAKFFAREHFGKLYHEIFSDDLNGTQTVIAVLIYRITENKRKRPSEHAPTHELYASCFIAMQMGAYLLRRMGIEIQHLTHQNFQEAKSLIASDGEAFFTSASQDVQKALDELYGQRDYAISLLQLSATFRRGDLISIMERRLQEH